MRLVRFLAVVALLLPAAAAAQISPGPLSRAHRQLEGATKCIQCHGTSREAMPRLCLSCHKEVSLLVSQGRGLHAREAKTSGRSCASCHPEHAGQAFDLIAWPAGGRDRFDHRGAGWPLEGKHAPLACAKCHKPEFRAGPVAELSPRKGSAGWMGLETACASCHKRDDPHQDSLGPKCERCHVAASWSPAPKFDHETSRYPLTGSHLNVACNKCHLAPTLRITPDTAGKRIPRFRPLEFGQCSSCHADPHKGRLSAKCNDCHVTQGFSVIDRRGFNHALTRYPLLGKHRLVSCEGCHGVGMAKPRPAFTSCTSCHADRHGGEATLAGAVVDCASCHQVDGFAPSTFTVAQHRTARFALNGKHEAVACNLCHKTTKAAGATLGTIRLRPAATKCSSCHAEPHGSQLPGSSCEQCHGDLGWKVSRYDRAGHAKLKLSLEGKHAGLACGDCHAAARPGLPALAKTVAVGTAGVVFRIPEIRCAACHADPHQVTGEGRRRDTTSSCAGCHSATAFRPATINLESHVRFAFPIQGAHRAVPCRDCHAGLLATSGPAVRGATLVGAAGARTQVALGVAKGKLCSSCHQTPHGTQFAMRADNGRCDVCHNADRFVGTLRFDHDRNATFSLKGAHAQVPCAKCHRSETIAGVARVIYHPVPKECENCHSGKTPGKPQ